MEVPQKLKIKLPYDLAIPLLGIYLDRTIYNSKRSLNAYVHSSTIHNSQDMKTT